MSVSRYTHPRYSPSDPRRVTHGNVTVLHLRCALTLCTLRFALTLHTLALVLCMHMQRLSKRLGLARGLASPLGYIQASSARGLAADSVDPHALNP